MLDTRVQAGKTVTITDLAIECDDGVRTIRRTNDRPVTRIKAYRPRIRNEQVRSTTGSSDTNPSAWKDQLVNIWDDLTAEERVILTNAIEETWLNNVIGDFLGHAEHDGAV